MVIGTTAGARANCPSPSMLPLPMPPSDVSATVAVPVMTPGAAVENPIPSAVLTPPAAMAPVVPGPAAVSPALTPDRLATRFSEYPSAAALFVTVSEAVPGRRHARTG